ncbi:MAG TPA: LLM class F420-dependent oxidoreductase [Candidatus Dormibacteraeota bacterium]
MATPQQIRFGIKTTPTGTTWEAIRDTWRLAERLGFDSAYLFDHMMPPSGDRSAACYEAWTTLSALATQVPRLQVGILVTANTYRYPSVLAKMAATLDVISGGRLELGLGAAWFEPDHLGYGIPFPPTPERISRLEEACHVIRMLWTQDVTNFKGRYYELSEAYCEPKPVRKPHPPILLGGGGEKFTLRVVARQADAWNIFQLSPAAFAQKSKLIDTYCHEAGRDPQSIEKSINAVLAIAENPKDAEQVLNRIARRRGEDPAVAKPTMLAGTSPEVIEQVAAYVRAGARHVVLSLQAPYETQQLEQFAADVMPAFRRAAVSQA